MITAFSPTFRRLFFGGLAGTKQFIDVVRLAIAESLETNQTADTARSLAAGFILPVCALYDEQTHTSKAMNFSLAIQQQINELKALENEITGSGPVARIKVTIDSSTNSSGKTYYRLRSPGRQKAQSLNADELKDWRQRIRRRNALQQVKRQVAWLKKTEVLVNAGIDWERTPARRRRRLVF